MSDPSLRPSRTSSGRELRRTFYLAALAWTVLAILLWAWIPTPASLAIAWALGLATVLLAGRGLSLREDERTRILADLAAERERLTSTLRGTSAATWEWNVETGDLVLDERWAEMLGYRLADLQPTSFETFGSRLHPDDLPRTLELVELHFADPEVMFESEFRLRHADGTWVWILGRGKLLSRTAAGEPLRMGGTHQEIG